MADTDVSHGYPLDLLTGGFQMQTVTGDAVSSVESTQVSKINGVNTIIGDMVDLVSGSLLLVWGSFEGSASSMSVQIREVLAIAPALYGASTSLSAEPAVVGTTLSLQFFYLLSAPAGRYSVKLTLAAQRPNLYLALTQIGSISSPVLIGHSPITNPQGVTLATPPQIDISDRWVFDLVEFGNGDDSARLKWGMVAKPFSVANNLYRSRHAGLFQRKWFTPLYDGQPPFRLTNNDSRGVLIDGFVDSVMGLP